MADTVDMGVARFKRAKGSESISPRDALVAAIAEIDSGEINPKHIIVGYLLPRTDDNQGMTGYFQGGTAEWIEQIGMVARLLHIFQGTD